MAILSSLFSANTKYHRVITLLMLLLCSLRLPSSAQATDEETVKAAFVYNFTHFVQWPTESFQTLQDSFIIGVVGDDVMPSLEELIAGEQYNGHPIVIKKIDTPVEATKVHLLFVNSIEGKRVTSLLAAVKGLPVLTVSDKTSFMKDSGMIRLYTADGKVRLEINARQADESRLIISAKLLNLARIYNEK